MKSHRVIKRSRNPFLIDIAKHRPDLLEYAGRPPRGFFKKQIELYKKMYW